MKTARLVEMLTIVAAALLFVYIGAVAWGMLIDLREKVQQPDVMIRVEARQFAWQFIYPDGAVSSELRVKAGQTVKLEMKSEDVIHSIFIRDFGLKLDVFPGKYQSLTFTPTERGKYLIQCAEFCGKGHYTMFTYLVVE